MDSNNFTGPFKWLAIDNMMCVYNRYIPCSLVSKPFELRRRNSPIPLDTYTSFSMVANRVSIVTCPRSPAYVQLDGWWMDEYTMISKSPSFFWSPPTHVHVMTCVPGPFSSSIQGACKWGYIPRWSRLAIQAELRSTYSESLKNYCALTHSCTNVKLTTVLPLIMATLFNNSGSRCRVRIEVKKLFCSLVLLY